ncbi:hypothetical protein ACFXHA_02415 [Nocardia sp. NPDC059240]|uniref:hypothetical protein n=1 Tax=Nocardia sp. NPDC059240 TaxID=3346786 RepID=UPI00367596B4
MTLYHARHSITTSLTGECAEHLPGRPEPNWRISWLDEELLLTREQATAAMELTETLLSVPLAVDGAWRRALATAAELGIDAEQARAVLARRRAERGES